MPDLEKEVVDIGDIGLASGRVNNLLYRDAEVGQPHDQDEDPESEVKHVGSVYIE